MSDRTSALGITTYRWNNNLKSALLLAAFPLLLLALLGGVFYVYGWANLDPRSGLVNPWLFRNFGFTSVLGTATPQDFALAAVAAWWPAALGVAAAWTAVGFFFNGAIIHMATGAKPVERRDAPEIYNLLENLCISRGMKMPRFYVIDTDALNAYASGIGEGSYAVTVTRGLLERLNAKELEAVLAHELTHIINRDCRLLIITVVFAGMISFLAQLLWRSVSVASYARSDDGQGRRRGGGAALLMLIGAVAMAVGYVVALLLRFALSRRREYMADAGAVELTKNPEALVAALRKIAGHAEVPNVPSEVRQMFIENPPSFFGLGSVFATHPPIEDRIRVLNQLAGTPAQGRSIIPPVG